MVGLLRSARLLVLPDEAEFTIQLLERAERAPWLLLPSEQSHSDADLQLEARHGFLCCGTEAVRSVHRHSPTHARAPACSVDRLASSFTIDAC